MDNRVDGASDEGEQHSDVDDRRRTETGIHAEEHRDDRSAESSEALEAFDRQVRDTALLGVDTADSHNEKRNCKCQTAGNHRINITHLLSASFLAFSMARFSSAIRFSLFLDRYLKNPLHAEKRSRMPVITEAISLATPKVEDI